MTNKRDDDQSDRDFGKGTWLEHNEAVKASVIRGIRQAKDRRLVPGPDVKSDLEAFETNQDAGFEMDHDLA